MITMLLACALSFSAAQSDYLWAPSSLYGRLFSRVDANSVGVQAGSAVILLTSQGRVQKELSIPDDQVVLFESKSDHLVFAPSKLVKSWNAETRESALFLSVGSRMFAQGRSLFIVRSSVSYLGEYSSAVFRDYDHLAGIGINAKGNRIAFLSLPSNVPLLTVSNLDEYRVWRPGPMPMVPEIEKVGYSAILPGHNDICFIRDDVIVFIGAFVENTEIGSVSKWERTLIDLSTFRLSEFGDKAGECYLFAVRLSDGWTRGVAKLRCGFSTERHGPFEGRMLASTDQRFLYIQSRDGLLRIPSGDIIKRCGF